MDLDSTGLRQRKGITKIVEDFDIFEKVVENVKEEKKVSSGMISFICFTVIFCLFWTETMAYLLTSKYDYRFTLDTEMEEMPNFEIDMIVNTPCKSLQAASSTDQYINGPFFGPSQDSIHKTPTRFEFTDEEEMYWTILRHANAQYNKQGLRGLEQLEYIDDDIESKLDHIAEEKEKIEADHIKEQRKKNNEKPGGHRSGNVMFVVGNGMGMFQLVAESGGDEAEGTACRLHGKFKVRKGVEEKIVISISNPMMIFNHFEGASSGNISHRIEKFHFGPRIPGLVTPLGGAEHISESGQDIYRYFIKIVPTKIYGYFTYTMAYQYSVTFLKKKLKEGEHSHGAILFEYEFTANVIEVRKASISFFSYLIRLCSIIGGVYATSTIINNIVQFVLSFLYPNADAEKLGNVRNLHNSGASLSTDSHTSLIMDANIRVH